MKPGDLVADRFLIERLAGSGGMGAVYRAVDRHTGEAAALKVMAGRGLDHVERFLRESQVLAELRHPGIVKYIAHGTTPAGEPWLALEWLEGESLGERLRRRGLTVAESVHLGLRVSEALAEAHRCGVVHRDLKPSNLHLVDRSTDRVKVLDFGIARHAGLDPLTMTGVVVGTPFYMSPEQARGEKEIDARADVFALGCVLFHCLTGRPPFAGEDMHAALLKVVLEEAPRLREIRQDIPEALDSLVARMLSKDRAGRPAEGGVVADELSGLGEIGSSPPAVVSRTSVALTTGERRIFCLMLARLPDAVEPAYQPTMPMTLPSTLPMGFSPGGEARAVPGEALGRIASRFHGRRQTLADGLTLITVEGPGVATDHAARAARCALEVRGFVEGVRIALVAGRGTHVERVPMGATIERAVRLLDRAQVDTIRLDDVMAGLLDARFDVEGDAGGLLLQAERDQVEASRTLLGRQTPFVGRDHEMGMLKAVLDQCCEEPTARAVLVSAPAGVGKSRLRYELLRQVRERQDRVQVWLGYGDPMSAGSPYRMLGQILRREAGLTGGEAPELAQQRLRARVARHVEPEDLTRVTVFLGEIAGVRFPDEASVELRSARGDAVLMGDQVRRAWEDFLHAECQAQPVLIVLEDLQWGDLPTVKLLDGALRGLREQPLMVLAMARPEVETVFPRLWAERGLQEIRLREIGRRGAEKLVREVLGEEVPASVVTRLVERAGGNAFYLEELIRAAAAGRTEILPETVLAMVQARLEALDPEARRVLRAASVFGQLFWRGGVSALLGGPEEAARIGDWLSVLVDRELIARRGEGKFKGQEEYNFRHALVREAAYATLTEGDRTLGHRLAGEWLEGAGEQDAALLAEHYERGGDVERAVVWFRRSAEQALEANDFRGAITRAGRGASSAEGEMLAAMRLIQAEAHKWLGEAAEAERCAETAMQHFPPGSALWYAAAAEAASMRVRLGRNDRLADLADELRALGLPADASGQSVSALARVAASLLHAGLHAPAQDLIEQLSQVAAPLDKSDAMVAARLFALRASRALCHGDPAESLECTERSIPWFLHAGDLRNACLNRVNAAHCLIQLGMYGRAETALKEALGEAERMSLHNVATFAKQNLGLCWLHLGNLGSARAVLLEAIEAFLTQENRRQEGRSRAYLAQVLSRLGDPAAAEAEAEAAVETLAFVPTLRAMALAVRARGLLDLGRGMEALVLAREALSLLGSLGGTEESEALIRLTYAEALRAAGHRGAARDAVGLAMDRLLERAQRIQDPGRRQSFCEEVPEHAKTFALATLWSQERDVASR
ncbi:serine/threonine-protein kinase [Chondromyces apiculatus]|uniref:Serine/threonine protein kinase n=1 Tax=Chondromyces apiculatus DSM 436 TaxID=1192034 RepID=A0A017TDY2_9BACT|nr:serine/threonine-protein kinase [Chondromyces apiculatus]EYF06826.1 Serine/threonine protein kinase [Chondromyces apiculatus DSM 436]